MINWIALITRIAHWIVYDAVPFLVGVILLLLGALFMLDSIRDTSLSLRRRRVFFVLGGGVFGLGLFILS